MARLPSVKRILTEELPKEVQAWAGKVIGPLNSFMEQATSALDGRLTFAENMAGEIRTVTLDGSYPIKLAWNKAAAPIGAWLIYVREATGNHTNLSAAVTVDWEYTGGAFQINTVTGIVPSPTTPFTIRIAIITG